MDPPTHSSAADASDITTTTPATAPTTPPPVPWGLATSYTQSLPSDLDFHPTSGFMDLARWIDAAQQAQPTEAVPRLCRAIPMYHSGSQKGTWTKQTGLTPAELQAYERGTTPSSARKEWKAKGSIGIVCSSLYAAPVLSSAGATIEWHVVGVARDEQTVWIHNCDFDPAEERLPNIPGVAIVMSMLKEWPSIQTVRMQGAPGGVPPGPQQCMGRSALWIQKTLAKDLPWPPDSDSSGGTWYTVKMK